MARIDEALNDEMSMVLMMLVDAFNVDTFPIFVIIDDAFMEDTSTEDTVAIFPSSVVADAFVVDRKGVLIS